VVVINMALIKDIMLYMSMLRRNTKGYFQKDLLKNKIKEDQDYQVKRETFNVVAERTI